MPLEQRDKANIADMIRYAREIVDIFTPGFTREMYGEVLQTRRSVERSLQLIGEAAKRVSNDFQNAHPEIPWRQVIGQRNVLVHEYGQVSDDLIWTLIERDLPPLIENLQKALDSDY